MLELAACQSAQARRHQHAVECRLRHRLTLLPWPHQRTLVNRFWRDVIGEEFIAGMECRGLRHGIVEIVVAVCTLATPTSHPRLVFVAEGVAVRDAHPAEDCRRHALFMTTSSNEPSTSERARVALVCAWMQLLQLRKNPRRRAASARRAVRRDMKHSTT